MATQNQESERVVFSKGFDVNMMAIDGTPTSCATSCTLKGAR
jgi:hypothetical protein